MRKTNIILGISTAVMAIAAMSSCKHKQNGDEIIVEKIIDKPQSSATNMASTEKGVNIDWAGSNYACTIRRAADASLGEINNHDSLFHDNRIELVIKRSDGSQFFSQTFTKDSFSGLLNNDTKVHGILISLAYDKNDYNNLYFVATIGSPDESYDDFTLVQLIVNRQGATSVAAYNPPEIKD